MLTSAEGLRSWKPMAKDSAQHALSGAARRNTTQRPTPCTTRAGAQLLPLVSLTAIWLQIADEIPFLTGLRLEQSNFGVVTSGGAPVSCEGPRQLTFVGAKSHLHNKTPGGKKWRHAEKSQDGWRTSDTRARAPQRCRLSQEWCKHAMAPGTIK